MLLINFSYSEIKNNLTKRIENTNTIFFKFKQKIGNKISNGNCYIKYPKLIRCDYEDSHKKRLISNGKTLAIIQRRYKKIFYYPLKTTPLYFIFDKKFLIDFINNNDPIILNDSLIGYEIQIDKKKLKLFFDKNSLNIKGWHTVDLYKNEVEFLINDLKTNIFIDENFFKIPSSDNL